MEKDRVRLLSESDGDDCGGRQSEEQRGYVGHQEMERVLERVLPEAGEPVDALGGVMDGVQAPQATMRHTVDRVTAEIGEQEIEPHSR